MKKTIIILGALLILTIGLTLNLVANGGGSVGGYSGAENQTQTCGTGGCHGGVNQTPTGWVTSNIPQSGYVPGSSYTITLAASHPSFNKFGFEMACVNGSGVKKGTFNASGQTSYKILPAGVGVGNATHTQSGNLGTNNAKTWNITWVAPVQGTGTVNFVATVIAANGNNGTSGDQAYTVGLSGVQENTQQTTDIIENRSLVTSVYPNPVIDILNVKYTKTVDLRIFDMNGKQKLNEINTNSVFVGDLDKGHYLLEIKDGENIFVERFIKQ